MAYCKTVLPLKRSAPHQADPEIGQGEGLSLQLQLSLMVLLHNLGYRQVSTPYGPLLRDLALELVDGTFHTVLVLSPLAMIWYITQSEPVAAFLVEFVQTQTLPTDCAFVLSPSEYLVCIVSVVVSVSGVWLRVLEPGKPTNQCNS